MKRIAKILMFSLFFVPQSSFAADATAGVDIATAYVFRGTTLNDSFVAQPYVELSDFAGVEGLTFGTWANFDLQDGAGGTPQSGEFSEIDFYGSYALPVELDPVGLSLGYTEYAYPNSDAQADRELSLVADIDAPLSPSLGVYVGVDNAIDEAVYIELNLSHEESLTDSISGSLSATGAYLFQAKDVTADDGFSFASVSAGLGYGCLAASVAYIFETDDEVNVVDEDVVGTLGISTEF